MPAHFYLHFPYCLYKCHYCDFNSHTCDDSAIPRAEYTAGLIAEIRRRRAAFAAGDAAFYPDGSEIATVFFGGGTPSLMPARDVGMALEELSRHFMFSPATEITLECNPGTVTLEKFLAFRAAGINRISIGVQSLDDRYLKVFGRIHSADEARQSLSAALSAGFERVSGDFIYGFPGQTAADWVAQLDEIASFGLGHISCYALTAEQGTVYTRELKDGKLTPPDADVLADMQEETYSRLGFAGLVPYEISNFAMPGEECRHNLAYWRYSSYAGLGAGACSQFFRQSSASGDPADDFAVRRTNHKIPDHYLGTLACDDMYYTEEAINRATALREAVMMGLRTREGLSLSGFARRFGMELFKEANGALARCHKAGWALSSHDRFYPTLNGFLFNNSLVGEVFTSLDQARS